MAPYSVCCRCCCRCCCDAVVDAVVNAVVNAVVDAVADALHRLYVVVSRQPVQNKCLLMPDLPDA